MKRKAKRKAARHKCQIPVAAAVSANAFDALVTAAAQAFALPLDPAWRAGIAFNLALIMRHAALVDEFALPEESEPAPVFHA